MKLLFLSIFGSSLFIFAHGLFLFEKQPFDGFTRYGCGRDGHCSMIISVLRDPRLMPAWTTKANAWNKALEQMQAYQQLFSSEHEEPMENLLTSDDATELEYNSQQDSSPQAPNRSKRFLPIFSTPKRHNRTPKDDNMYWLIRMPGK